MAEGSNKSIHKKYAVVTGANKGIGLEICRQLASHGITVVLTCRNEKRGLEAIEKLKQGYSGISDSVVFHQLDVTDSTSIVSLAEFIKSQFGKLDILVNNAGIIGITADDSNAATASFDGALMRGESKDWEVFNQTYDSAVACLQTNYHGTKQTTETLLPLLQLSDSPRIVNVSSLLGKLGRIANEPTKGVLNGIENLTEMKIEELLDEFLKDFQSGSMEAKGWPIFVGAYTVSKAAVNAYTRILANKYPRFRINCVCPGFVKTDLNYNSGVLTVEEGAETPVMAALFADDGPTGTFFVRNQMSSFVE